MVDHGVLDGKAAIRGKDLLVVRGAVFARIGNAPVQHGLLGLVQIPALGAGAAQGDAVQCVQCKEQVHHRGGHQIEVLQRLTQHGHAVRYIGRNGSPLRHHKELCPVGRDGEQGIAALVFCSRELLCVVQCSSPGRYQLHFHRGTGLLGTGGQQQPGGGQEPQKLAACDLVHLIPA